MVIFLYNSCVKFHAFAAQELYPQCAMKGVRCTLPVCVTQSSLQGLRRLEKKLFMKGSLEFPRKCNLH